MSAFVHELRVRYGECDPQKIVFNANYLLYFDVAFTELWRDAVGPWDDMTEQWGVDAVVAESVLRFRAPARFDDVIALQLTVARLGRASIETHFVIRRDEEVLVEGEMRHVVVDARTWQSTEMPAQVREGLSRFAA